MAFLLTCTLSLFAQTNDNEQASKVSKLEMPNAFTPNGDGINDVYRAKQGHENIVSFRATIFNRRGERLFQWTDIDGGWDGTHHGHLVSDGVYYVKVEAKGADGQHFNIKKSLTLLRHFNDQVNR